MSAWQAAHDHAAALLALHRPMTPLVRRQRAACRIADDLAATATPITIDLVDTYLVPAPYLPADDDEARTASDRYEHDLHREDRL